MENAKNILINKWLAIVVMILCLFTSIVNAQTIDVKYVNSCENRTDHQENGESQIALSLFAAIQSPILEINLEYHNVLLEVFVQNISTTSFNTLLNQFDIFRSKIFMVLVRRIISPNAP